MMKSNKYLLVVLSVFLISLVFIASASATDVNETTEVLSIDESTNILNNGTDALDYSSDNTVSNDNIAVNPKTDIIVPPKIFVCAEPGKTIPRTAVTRGIINASAINGIFQFCISAAISVPIFVAEKRLLIQYAKWGISNRFCGWQRC